MSSKRPEKGTKGKIHCTSCGAAVAKDDRFCRQCGAALSPDAKANGKPSGLRGLRAFGLAVIALALVYAFIHYGSGALQEEPVPVQPISISDIGSGEPSAAPVPAEVSPRGRADLLFDQAMTAYESGDSVTASQLIPTAIAAHRTLPEPDLDARYHIALLSLAGGRPEAALAQADTILAEVPDHLLALSVAGRAHATLGDVDRAAEYFRRFLSAYTPERAASRSEYMDHGRALPARRDAARAYLREHGLLDEGS